MGNNSNKRIAKNTIALYFRTLFTLFVSLYTSRMILSELGESDFGIFNIVGGIVALSSFFQYSIMNSIQRYLNFELGKGNNENAKKIFCVSIEIQFLICAIVVLLGETIGLWFVSTQLNIPENRMYATHWVYQLSLLSCCVQIFRAPYAACIITYEKMTVYAYISILETIAKLIIVFLLVMSTWDKLIYYTVLLLLVSIIVSVLSKIYCDKRIEISRFKWVKEIDLTKEIFSFAGWNLLTQTSNACYNQGITILINLFFGVLVNAAAGIATQVSNAVGGFVGSFQMAFKPQIVKTWAAGERTDFLNLIIRSAKVSFFLLYIFDLPLILNIDFVLDLWLVEVPAYTNHIVVWTLLATLIASISTPIWFGVQAKGELKKFLLIVSTTQVLSVPVMYLVLKNGGSPVSIYIVGFILYIIFDIIHVILFKQLVDFPISTFFYKVVVPLLLVVIASSILPIILSFYLSEWTKLIVISFVSVICCTVAFMYLGLTRGERKSILSEVKKRIPYFEKD